MKIARINPDGSTSIYDENVLIVTISVENVVVPIKAGDWPLILRPLKLLSRQGDKGLGDIVERVIGPIGGDAYKLWFEKTFGRVCGCTEREDRLNERFPLE